MVSCRYCGGNDVEYSESRGETYCTKCGAVLEENRMVESVSFAETSSGAVRAVGHFVPTSAFGGGFAMTYGSRESREQALQRGYSHIQRIADRLRLPMNLIESAQRVYLMGVQRNFTMGRLSSHVAAACLYVCCRREKSPQMLIDFSDVLTTPVKTLGAVFVKLLRVLHIHVPTIDPSLFMERFAAQIALGDKTNAVAQTGVRLVQAMARDWICTGRRPTGLCGAALLIAARYHGIKINAEDISSVIRMAASTVTKRLSEFRQTSTAQLKSGEFETTDLLSLPILEGPPCLLRSKSRNKRERIAIEANEELYQLTDEPSSYDPIEVTGRLVGGIRLEANQDEICESAPSSSSISSLAQRMLGAIESQVPLNKPVNQTQTTVAETQDIEVNENTDGDPEDTLGELLRDVKEKVPILGNETPNMSTALAVPEFQSHELDNELDESLGDVSDSEIDWMLLPPEEKKAKTLIWDELMREVMPEVHRRLREKRRKEREHSARKPRRKTTQRTEIEPAASPAESVRTALETKNRSFAKRLNGDALNSLFSGSQMNEAPNSYQSLFS